MTTTRLEQLIRFYEEDPSDPFTLYGLALEYLKIDTSKSEAYFDKLLTDFQQYLPTYYHAAKLKATIGKKDEAIDIYEKGIQVAIAQEDKATHRELKSAYEEFLFDSDIGF
jgi:tetratricopeptide (TPR) repeat protein